MDVQEYRQLILDDLLARKTDNGDPLIGELAARDLLNELSDDELKMGMSFNDPKDIADIIIQLK